MRKADFQFKCIVDHLLFFFLTYFGYNSQDLLYPKESQENYKRKEDGTLLLSKFQSPLSASGSQGKRQQQSSLGSKSGGSDRGSLGNTAREEQREHRQVASFPSLPSLTGTRKGGSQHYQAGV